MKQRYVVVLTTSQYRLPLILMSKSRKGEGCKWPAIRDLIDAVNEAWNYNWIHDDLRDDMLPKLETLAAKGMEPAWNVNGGLFCIEQFGGLHVKMYRTRQHKITWGFTERQK